MAGYDYGNARLRAMKSRLLTLREIEALADLRSVDGLIAALAKTVYRPALEAVIVYASGVNCVTETLRLDSIETLGRVRGFYDGHERALIDLLLRRYDVENLKTVLRGLSKHAAPDAIKPALIPVGELTDAVLGELIRTDDVRAAIDRLASMRFTCARPLLDLRATRPGAAVLEMELALDRWYFDDARARLGGGERTLAAALAVDADVINIITALRFASAPAERIALRRYLNTDDVRTLMVSAGSVPLDALARAAEQGTLDESLNLLRGTPYFTALTTGLTIFRQSRRLSDIEKPLRVYRLRHMAALIVQDPLGIGVPLAYFALKMSEVANLRAIAQGIHLGLDAKAIKQALEFAL